MSNKSHDGVVAVILNSITVLISFTAVTALCIFAVFMYSTNGEFVDALKGEVTLPLGFYVSSLAVIVISSILYTPFSCGISYYFVNSNNDTANIRQIFYLFHRPKHLVKAILIEIAKRVTADVLRIVTLAFALLAECGIFVISVILSGKNIFDYEQNFFEEVSRFILHDRFFIILTVAEWIAVITVFVYIRMRYSLCKYVFIRYPHIRIAECLRVSGEAIRGNIIRTAVFYVKNLSRNIVAFCNPRYKPKKNFSAYATELAEAGFERYTARRSAR